MNALKLICIHELIETHQIFHLMLQEKKDSMHAASIIGIIWIKCCVVYKWVSCNDSFCMIMPVHDCCFVAMYNFDWIYRNRSKLHIGRYEIINFKDFKAL